MGMGQGVCRLRPPFHCGFYRLVWLCSRECYFVLIPCFSLRHSLAFLYTSCILWGASLMYLLYLIYCCLFIKKIKNKITAWKKIAYKDHYGSRKVILNQHGPYSLFHMNSWLMLKYMMGDNVHKHEFPVYILFMLVKKWAWKKERKKERLQCFQEY